MKLLLVYLAVLPFTISLKLKVPLAQLSNPYRKTNDPEQLSSAAIERLYDRLFSLSSTSCKVSAKFILLTIAGVEDKYDITKLKLTNNSIDDIDNIRTLLNKNYIIQIEIRPNHHFVIFKKNDEYLYLLQGFQDIFTLKEWMSNQKIMEPYLTIERFFELFTQLLTIRFNDNDTEQDIKDKKVKIITILMELFYPLEFSKDPEKQQNFVKWFYNRLPVTLINVDYVKYKFNENQSNEKFYKLWNKVDSSYYILELKHLKHSK